MNQVVIRLEAVSKNYGTIPVLKNLSFEVREGEAFAIIGPNGAGKTTMFRTLTGEVQVTAGRIFYEQADITKLPEYQRVRLGMGRTFQVARIFPDSTVLENMVVAVESRPGSARATWWRIAAAQTVHEEAMERLSMVGLSGKENLMARILSHGDKKRLEFAMMLARSPRVLMMDEPTAGMSPADRHETIDLLKRVRGEQRQTLLLTEHDMDVVFDLADRILVLNYGELIALGTPDEIRGNEAVRNVYLGQESELALD